MNTLQDYLLETFLKYSNNTAIITEKGICVSYYSLFERVKNGFCFIKERYGSKNQILIKLKKLDDIIVTMLACMFSNNTFVPVDYYCTELHEKLIKETLKTYTEINVPIQEKSSQIRFGKEKYDLSVPIYIYFTSGSTGKPKAVLGRNTSLLHYILWEIEKFSINEKDMFAQLTNIMFDPFLRDIFVPLLCGGTIVAKPSNNIVFSPRLLLKWMKDRRVTCVHCTPSLLNIITRFAERSNLDRLHYIFIAGEKILTQDMKNWATFFDNRTKFVNLYGPTETTLAKCFHVINKERKYGWVVPVGKAIADEKIYILSENKKECIDGEIGEICIDMKYGTWGYIDGMNPEKFEKNFQETGHTIYHTGDMGYWEKEEIVIIGRRDRQIKINGVRIELDSIESLIRKEVYISDVAVALKDNCIMAFVVIKNEVEKYENMLKQQILDSLPAGTLKCRIVRVDEVKLTMNGKKNYNYMLETYDI